MGSSLVVAGGRVTEQVGWLTKKIEVGADVALLERFPPPLHWRIPQLPPLSQAEAPAPREFHTMTAISGNRLILFGGGS